MEEHEHVWAMCCHEPKHWESGTHKDDMSEDHAACVRCHAECE